MMADERQAKNERIIIIQSWRRSGVYIERNTKRRSSFYF